VSPHRTVLPVLLALALGCAPRPPDLVFVVLDTVRSDFLSACGHPHPTSPHLDALAARPTASFTCLAEAPATWTIPSHASFLSGLHYQEHGAGFGGFRRPSPVPPGLETLPQRLGDRYQTLLVSGNPLLGKAGLDRGFEVVSVAGQYDELYGEALVEALTKALARRDRRPLFLLLNISDAHMPWADVPPGHPWLPATPGLRYSTPERKERARLLRGQLGEAAAEAYRQRLRHLYEHAVERADRTLGAALEELQRVGVLRRGYRLVLTSDHGERLGERGLIGHGPVDLRETVTRVPLLFASDRDRPVAFPSPVSALETHSLLLDGRLRGHPIVAAGFSTSVAWWSAEEKLMWLGGRPLLRFAGLDDAGEGEEVAEHPRKADLERMRLRLEERWQLSRTLRDEGESEELGRDLAALGYLDAGER
jgi:hypothetical protein